MKDYKIRYCQKTDENPFLPAHEVVKEVLRDDICTCLIPPGERLKEAQVAQQFGVSRTTVRRAFESLLAEDWLVHSGKQGVKVTPLSMKQYKEMIELRACLDSFAARMAAVRRSSKALAELQRHIRLSEDAGYFEHYRADVAFHRAIYYAAGNSYLTDIYEHISFDLSRVKSYITGGGLTQEDKRQIIAEHTAIFEAIKGGNGKEAFLLSQRHARMILTGTVSCAFEHHEGG